MLKESFTIIFASEKLPTGLFERLSSKEVKHEQCFNESNLAELEGIKKTYPLAEFIILDGYNLGTAYQKRAKDLGLKVIVIDDHLRQFPYADLVFNHAPSPPSATVKHLAESKYLLGLQYALLQPCFLALCSLFGNSRSSEKRDGIFLNMGGLDSENITLSAAQELLLKTEIGIKCVVGNYYTGINDLRDLGQEYPNRLKIYKNLNHEQIAELMYSCKIGITPASTIAIEACACRLPLITGWVLENQKLIYDGLIAARLALPLGNLAGQWHRSLAHRAIELLSNEELMREIVQNQCGALDGRSGERVLTSIADVLDLD